MSETLVSTIAMQLTALLSSANTFGTAQFNLQQPQFLNGTLNNGTGADNANQVYALQNSVASGASVSLNLNTMGGATDALGNALAFANIKGLALKVLGNLGCTYVSAGVVNAAGTGYLINDVLTTAGGTGTEATFKVTTVGGGGAVTGLLQLTPGSFTANPGLVANAVTGGAGAGATLTLTMATVVANTPPTFVEGDYLTIGNVGSADGWTSLLSPNTATLLLKSGTLNLPGTITAVEGGGTGWVVGVANNRTLKITNSGANPVTYLLIVIGATA